MSKTGTSGRIESFWAELRRRRVIRVVVFYLVAGWVVIEIASTVFPNLQVPDWGVTLVTVLVALGFVPAVALAWVFDVEPSGIRRTPESAPEPVAHPAEPLPEESGAEVAGDARRSVAVLPFVNMSGDPENEYFSDGIAEEILNLLTKLPQLRVASRTSSFKFKGKDIDIPEVAGTLGVGTLLEGSVRRAGDRVRITAQLIDVRTDSHLWSETYDRELKDVFAIQDDIARSIVAALEVKLTPRDRRALQYVATSDTKAYDYYLRGRRYFYKFTRLHFYNAIRMFKKAIEQDPNYALAYAGMADAHSLLYHWADSSEENIRKANEASIKAITLDPDSAEAHAARGTALTISGQHEEAERAYENAILLNPSQYEPYYFYGRDCLGQGKYEKAARLFSEAHKVNPDDYQAPWFLAMALAALGREQERQEHVRKTVKCVEKHLDLYPDDARALTFGSTALVALGESERALEWAERALEADKDEPAVLYNVACAFSLLGDKDRAFELLEQSVNHGYGHREWLEHDSDFAPLRDDPRFQQLLDRMG